MLNPAAALFAWLIVALWLFARLPLYGRRLQTALYGLLALQLCPIEVRMGDVAPENALRHSTWPGIRADLGAFERTIRMLRQ